MRELTTIEQELIDQLVAFWRDASRELSGEFYRALAALGQQRNETSVHRLLTDEVFKLRRPEHASHYREQFPNEEAYRHSLMARIVALWPSARQSIPPQESASDSVVNAAPEMSTPTLEADSDGESLVHHSTLAELTEYWDTGRMSTGLETRIRSYDDTAAVKSLLHRIFETVAQWGRAGIDIKGRGYEDNRRGFRAYLANEMLVTDLYIGGRDYKRLREERRKQVQAEFDALGESMNTATSRRELAELTQQRAAIAPLTGQKYEYESHCWSCHKPISSEVNPQCSACEFYICECGKCLCGFPGKRT